MYNNTIVLESVESIMNRTWHMNAFVCWIGFVCGYIWYVTISLLNNAVILQLKSIWIGSWSYSALKRRRFIKNIVFCRQFVSWIWTHLMWHFTSCVRVGILWTTSTVSAPASGENQEILEFNHQLLWYEEAYL